MQTRPILIDTDPGIDDAMAIAFAEFAPELDVVALTTVAGNATIAQTTFNALSLRTRFGMGAVVARGAGSAIDGRRAEPPAFVHGDDGLGNTGPMAGDGALANESAAQLIVTMANEHAGALTVIALGQLTNLAHALRLDTGLVERVARIIVMGGAFGTGLTGGNVTPVAEANAHGDPLAADIVFNAGWPVTVVGLDVTMQTVIDAGFRERLRRSGPVGEYLWEISGFYDRFYRDGHGIDGFPVHDSSAVAFALDAALFATESGRVRVAQGGAFTGQTTFVPARWCRDDGAWSRSAAVDVCFGVDSNALLDRYLAVLAGH